MENFKLKSIQAKVFTQGDEDGYYEDVAANKIPYILSYNGMRTFEGAFEINMIFINSDGERELMSKEKFDRMYEKFNYI